MDTEIEKLETTTKPSTNLHRKSFPICPKCNQSCSKQENESFVRAFNQVYHYHCFICEDCQIPVANKYFALENQPLRKKRKKIILCETDYLKRSSRQVCCDGIDQFEFKGKIYCRYHYSLLDETHCSGCNQAILNNFIEHPNYPNQIWHPECYMIYKFWNIKIQSNQSFENENELIEIQKDLQFKVKRIWTDLSTFEESSANCIQDMLYNIASGSLIKGIKMANQFVIHLEILFSALSKLQALYKELNKEFKDVSQANSICQEIIHFFELLSTKKSETPITPELISLVTTLAKHLKYLLKLSISSAYILENEFKVENAVIGFLNELLELEKKRLWINDRYRFKDLPNKPDTFKEEIIQCDTCQQLIQLEYFKYKTKHWHPNCFHCNSCSNLLLSNTARINEKDEMTCSQCQPNLDFNNQIEFIYSYQHSLNKLKLYLSKTSTEVSKEEKSIMSTDPKRHLSFIKLFASKIQSKSNSVHLRPMAKNNLNTSNDRPFIDASNHIPYLNSSQNRMLRYLASVTLQPLINLSLNDILNFIDIDSNPRKSNPNDLWGKILTHIKGGNLIRNHSSFGLPLDRVAQRDHEFLVQHRKEVGVTLSDDTPTLNACFSENAFIPIFIKSCIKIILKKDMSTEGVFRKNGNIRLLKNTSEMIDQLNPITPEKTEEFLSGESGIQLAALLKKYLRALPEPLLTYSLYPLFIKSGKEQNPILRKKLLHLTCCLMPKANRDTMFMIFCCLRWVSNFSDTNKMDIPNLARVIAPSVLYGKSTSTDDLRLGAQEEINVIEALITEVEDFSIIPHEFMSLNFNQTSQELTDVNSKQLIAEYAKLLKESKQRINQSNIESIHSISNHDLPSKRVSEPNFSLKNQIPNYAFDALNSDPKSKRSSWISGIIATKKN